ncbi:LacI family transcriptional regulator [Microbacterium sp. CFH 90308]|uniref:LacI family transcriptional regulator n=1 Tax=Microbacterium salsuginis TaxID=2722803 RepID=A0ABX1K8C8_9MICO|nr:LacI family DNA-binding transcriptional regulator [Microbacterium sp. CFH 90308]NLP83209.1 LacI family transcriptional regulator [Microbacterium sp. CFH 90308]
MARLKDVAALAGVSPSVASRVLNNDTSARINDNTRQRVIDAAAELRYVPDHRARALRLSRADAIALIVPEVNNAIFSSLHQGVQSVAHERNSAVFLAQFDAETADANALAQLIGNGRVDGVIVQRNEHFTDDDLIAAIQLDVPVVLVNTRLDGHAGSVALNDREAVAIAVTHLVELGHKRIGFVAGAPRHDAATRRLEGFRDAMTVVGLAAREDWIAPAGWEAPAGAAATSGLLKLAARPTALVTASLNTAIGAMRAAHDAGIQVPGDLSIIAVQDAWMSEYTVPRLTTVAMPMREAGARAASMLLDHLGGVPLSDELVTEPHPQLMIRESTTAPVGGAPASRAT